jgi:hypothetical protein
VRRPCTLISNTTFRPLTTRGFEAADVSGIFIAPSAPATCARSFFLHFSASPSVPPCQRLAGLASAAPESQVSSARARLPRPQLAQEVCLQLLLARACFASDAQPAAPSALSQTDARASPPAHAGVEATSSARRARGCGLRSERNLLNRLVSTPFSGARALRARVTAPVFAPRSRQRPFFFRALPPPPRHAAAAAAAQNSRLNGSRMNVSG